MGNRVGASQAASISSQHFAAAKRRNSPSRSRKTEQRASNSERPAAYERHLEGALVASLDIRNAVRLATAYGRSERNLLEGDA